MSAGAVAVGVAGGMAGTVDRSTSAQALQALGRDQKTQFDCILDIVTAAVRRGAKDLTRREIQAAWEKLDGNRHESSVVAARVNQLLAQHRLVEVEADRRLCAITGRLVQPVTVAAQQARMF